MLDEQLAALGFSRDERSVTPSGDVHLEVTPERFVAMESAIRAAGPRSLTLRKAHGLELVQRVAASSALECVTTLRLRGKPSDEAAGILGRSTTLREVHELDVSGAPLGDEGILALVGAPWARSLRALDLGHSKLTDAGGMALANVTAIAGLAKLGAYGIAIGDPSVTAIARAAVRLREVTLNNTRLTAAGLSALLSSPAQLEGLMLVGCKLGPEAAPLLAASVSRDSLVQLDLTGAEVGDDGVAALSRGAFHSLERLSLGSNGIGPAGVEALAKASWVEQLVELRLSNNALGPAGAASLAAARMPRLTDVGLSDTALDDSAAGVLARAAFLPHLTFALLHRNMFGAVGLRHLLDAGATRAAVELFLGENPIGDAGAEALSAHLPASLRVLWLNGCGIGDPGALSLLRALDGASLRELVLSENAITGTVSEAILERFPDAVLV